MLQLLPYILAMSMKVIDIKTAYVALTLEHSASYHIAKTGATGQNLV